LIRRGFLNFSFFQLQRELALFSWASTSWYNKDFIFKNILLQNVSI
jgi:hypothetical protein